MVPTLRSADNLPVTALSVFKIVQWVFKLVALFWDTRYLPVKDDGLCYNIYIQIFIHSFYVVRSVQDTKLTGQDTCLCDDPTKSWRLFVHRRGIFGNDGRNQNISVAALSASKIVQWVSKLVALFGIPSIYPVSK